MKLREYLDSLGKTPDEIAENLRKQGVKGKRNCTKQCIILNAIYTGPAKDNVWSGMIIHGGVNGHYSATYQDVQIMDPTLPKVIQEFIAAFDAGKYPDLVATKVREVTTRVWE